MGDMRRITGPFAPTLGMEKWGKEEKEMSKEVEEDSGEESEETEEKEKYDWWGKLGPWLLQCEAEYILVKKLKETGGCTEAYFQR
eukprot:g38363.t1